LYCCPCGASLRFSGAIWPFVLACILGIPVKFLAWGFEEPVVRLVIGVGYSIVAVWIIFKGVRTEVVKVSEQISN